MEEKGMDEEHGGDAERERVEGVWRNIRQTFMDMSISNGNAENKHDDRRPSPPGFEDLQYLRGFGNGFSSEAIQGALPNSQNSPLKCPFGLYAEQISGTPFTAPRKANQRSWLYRMKPSVTHEPFYPRQPAHEHLLSDFSNAKGCVTTPTQLRWKPSQISEARTDFIDGLFTICGAGSCFVRHGYAIHMYAANVSMEGYAFANADGDFLIVPQQGRLWIKTECGRLQVSPGEMVVLQLGFRFSINLPDGASRGYVLEVFSGHFQLPDLGPIGANGLAEPQDFLTPVAWYEEQVHFGFKVVQKFGGALFEAKQDFSPFNVIAWRGNYAPFKYELSKFCPFSTTLFDHADPSINTVLTVPSEIPGVAVVDFVVFPTKWLVAEHTFLPPYFHRNCMSEFMGLIYGLYEGKAEGFLPGGASLHSCMTPHGVDTLTYEKTVAGEDDSKPSKVSEDTLAFMFESSLTPKITPWAFNSPDIDPDYYKCWIGLRSHFDQGNANLKVTRQESPRSP